MGSNEFTITSTTEDGGETKQRVYTPENALWTFLPEGPTNSLGLRVERFIGLGRRRIPDSGGGVEHPIRMVRGLGVNESV